MMRKVLLVENNQEIAENGVNEMKIVSLDNYKGDYFKKLVNQL